MTPDIINGLFEFLGALFQTRNIWALLQDRQVKGVRPLPVAFFSLWGAWNMLRNTGIMDYDFRMSDYLKHLINTETFAPRLAMFIKRKNK
jgi:hypothetical protein